MYFQIISSTQLTQKCLQNITKNFRIILNYIIAIFINILTTFSNEETEYTKFQTSSKELRQMYMKASNYGLYD